MLNFAADVLLPPTSLAVLTFLLLLGGRRARGLAILSTAILVLLAMPKVAALMLNSLAPPPVVGGPAPSAIVILSADGVHLPGPDDLEPGLFTLDRLRAGAALQRRTGLPILVAGGQTDSQMSLAGMMSRSLRDDFRVPVKWEESRSLDTWENAVNSAALLKPAGITRVYVVTHFWHMRRALVAFRAAGLDPVPAPVRDPFELPLSAEQFVPRPSAWTYSYLALHEWVGLLYYSTLR